MNGTVLVLRTCDKDLRSYNGFQWPREGPVNAPDWSPDARCGHGLHGLLWGEGDGGLLNWSVNAIWQVVRVPEAGLVDLRGKVKYPCGEVVFTGTRLDATAYIIANGALGRAVVGSTLTGGDGSTLTGGDRSTLTGGDRSTLTGGDRSTLTGGYGSTLTGGDRSMLLLRWYDSRTGRCRNVFVEVGEVGIKPGVAYRVDDAGRLAKRLIAV